jgi:hypothetical protein
MISPCCLVAQATADGYRRLAELITAAGVTPE